MINKTEIKGIIFDLDGTLIDSMQIWYDIDRRFLMENGVENPPREISDKVKRMTVEQAADFFIEQFSLKCTQEYVIKRIEELVRIEYEEKIPLKPYAMELLDNLDNKGIPYGIATATYSSLARAVLERHGIYDRIKFLLTDAEYPRGKKFPDIFMGAAELLGTKPGETIVVEDSLHSVITAKNAGFITAAVYDEASAEDRTELEKNSDYYFTSLKEMTGVL
ncbi:MAG: HAD family phosphatase [Ruminococcus sp.]|nr:HAD family phosphatase [Ruminococcus sp.]